MEKCGGGEHMVLSPAQCLSQAPRQVAVLLLYESQMQEVLEVVISMDEKGPLKGGK